MLCFICSKTKTIENQASGNRGYDGNKNRNTTKPDDPVDIHNEISKSYAQQNTPQQATKGYEMHADMNQFYPPQQNSKKRYMFVRVQ